MNSAPVHKRKSNLEVFEQIRKGNKQAFKKLFARLFPELCGFVCSYTADEDRAKDIVQEAFINLWNRRQQIAISSSLESYLYRICYHKYIDDYRRNKSVQKGLEDFRYYQLYQMEEREEVLIKEKKSIELNRAVEGLPPRCREVVVLSKYRGLRQYDIAEELGLSKKTVESQMRIAYSKLRRVLG